jgi:DNA recombination protein RmuC
VVLATPTTLIALLRTVAQGWSHEALADQAREIHRLGRDLHQRLGLLSTHLDRVGRSLNTAVGHFNQAVGSYESRVLVSARRFTELSVVSDDLDTPRQVESISRSAGSIEPGSIGPTSTGPGPHELRTVDRRAASGEE